VDHLGKAPKRIQLRQTALFYKADKEYGQRVAKGIGLDLNEVKRLAGMSQEERAKATEK
jgi:catalase